MIRVLLVDDQQLVREGLRSLLEVQPDLEVIAEAENGQQAVEQAIALQPDIILMDVRMPIMDGIAATAQVSAQAPAVKVLILTTFDDEDYVGPAIRNGAKGYLLKDTPSAELAEAIRTIHRGYSQMSPGLLAKAIAPPISPKTTVLPSQTIPPEFQELTPREQDVLRLIVSGQSNREIAQTLVISERTVKNHVNSILRRLNVRDRTQAALVAQPYYQGNQLGEKPGPLN
jgi:DNA-binding NarL/FixJ family response regulator